MKKYRLRIERIAYGNIEIEVKARSMTAAREKALDEAGDHEFSTHDADYKVAWIEEVEK